jgi:hypothetical protein
MYADHPEFKAIDDDKLLWRYLDLPRYIDLLIKKKIFFCRADRFEDPFEGKFNKLSEEQFINNQGEKSGASLADFLDEHAKKRMRTTVNCWHQNNDENYAMWQIYSRGDFGIAIQTNFKCLKESFEKTQSPIHIGKVNYFDESAESLPVDGEYAPFLNKRNVYNYENEVRCCYTAEEAKKENFDWEKTDEPNGVFIDVDLNKLIQKIYISPNSPKWFKDVVKDINLKYGMDAELIQSKVFESLDFSY